MSIPLLHYIHDPLCGWCYAALPLVEAAVGDGFGIELHGGNLWAQSTRLSEKKRNYIRQHDKDIAELAKRPFGAAYLGELLNDPETVFWSQPTIAAILAAGTLRCGADLAMLHAIQTAHYIQGRRVVDTSVLVSLARQIELEPQAFIEAFDACRVEDHIQNSRHLMSRFGLHGFPGFVLEHQSVHMRVTHEPFYGKPDAFVRQLHAIASGRG